MKNDEIEVVLDRGTIMVIEDNRSTCRSCGEPIIWCITAKGKKMPVDEPENDEPTTSHFATCKQADEWRRR